MTHKPPMHSKYDQHLTPIDTTRLAVGPSRQGSPVSSNSSPVRFVTAPGCPMHTPVSGSPKANSPSSGIQLSTMTGNHTTRFAEMPSFEALACFSLPVGLQHTGTETISTGPSTARVLQSPANVYSNAFLKAVQSPSASKIVSLAKGILSEFKRDRTINGATPPKISPDQLQRLCSMESAVRMLVLWGYMGTWPYSKEISREIILAVWPTLLGMPQDEELVKLYNLYEAQLEHNWTILYQKWHQHSPGALEGAESDVDSWYKGEMNTENRSM